MQFTAQQLSGGPRYGSKTRIGNWNEEISLSHDSIATFENTKIQGTLSLQHRHTKMQASHEKVALTADGDGLIRFGSVVCLEHAMSGASLATDLDEEVRTTFHVPISY